jgi:hypothetical protein
MSVFPNFPNFESEGEMSQAVIELFNFINEPPPYEELRMVREYRHDLARRWLPVQAEIERLRARVAELEQKQSTQRIRESGGWVD